MSPSLTGMCGAGTFAVEAASMARRLAPGLSRSFLFERWPSFQEKTWAYLRRKEAEEALPNSPVPIFASDVDPEAVARCPGERGPRRGGRRCPVGGCRFLLVPPPDRGIRPGLVALDPPYGKRLSEGGGICSSVWVASFGTILRVGRQSFWPPRGPWQPSSGFPRPGSGP